ncbi:MAG: hypothetical protein FRX49_10431 [Trebouxia sp. A1-2]|nr:MAG: hypothetical protein FRX49_10431 [Trebouxia sp. A1-2]
MHLRPGQLSTQLMRSAVVDAAMLIVMHKGCPVGAPHEGPVHGFALDDAAMAQQHKIAQLAFIQVHAVQDAALLDQVEEQDRQCMAWGGFSKCKDIKLPAAVCGLESAEDNKQCSLTWSDQLCHSHCVHGNEEED